MIFTLLGLAFLWVLWLSLVLVDLKRYRDRKRGRKVVAEVEPLVGEFHD